MISYDLRIPTQHIRIRRRGWQRRMAGENVLRKGQKIYEPDAVRFERLYIPEPNTGCWLWIGAMSFGGRGAFRLSRPRRQVLAHRFSYEEFIGPIPEGLTVDHQCNNPCCVNPDHLKAMTQLENGRRYTQSITHCPKGHAYIPENTRIQMCEGYKTRVCRECGRLADAAYYRRKKAKKNGF